MDRVWRYYFAWGSYRTWRSDRSGGVVTRNVAPYEVVAGCPARHISWRFSEEKRAQIMDLQWWDWSDERMCENMGLLNFDVDIEHDEDKFRKLIEMQQKQEE